MAVAAVLAIGHIMIGSGKLGGEAIARVAMVLLVMRFARGVRREFILMHIRAATTACNKTSSASKTVRDVFFIICVVKCWYGVKSKTAVEYKRV